VKPLISCRGKVAFLTFALAQDAAKRARRNKDSHTRTHPYRCEHCANYHIGGQRPQRAFKRPRVEPDHEFA
jgi:hypothetical protein